MVAQVNQTIAAGTAAQTAITIQGSAGSGNADHTPVVGEVWLCATATGNVLTNWDVFQVSGTPTATSLTFASRTVVAARAAGDFCWVISNPATQPTGSSTFGTLLMASRWYWGLSTVGAQTTIAAASDTNVLPQATITVAGASTAGFAASGNLIIVTEKGEQNVAYTGTTATTFTGCTGGTGTIDTGDLVYQVPTQATILSNEPTATGAYARVAQTNNAANLTASTGTYPAAKTTGAAISWAQSTAAWSSGANNLNILFASDSSTLAGGNVVGWALLTNPQTVNASGITPSVAAGSFTFNLL